MQRINKSFGGTQALREVNFSATRGEVHAIVGENGAGKSTLMKILAGALLPDSGETLLDGKSVQLDAPHQAFDLGIRTVYQEFSLIAHLTVTENILLGQMPTGRSKYWVDWPEAHRQAKEILQNLNFIDIDVRTPVSRLSVSHRQMVEIAKALAQRPGILVLDEPSAVLSPKELERLFALIQKLKKESTLVLYISHRLEEMFEIADRITVLRDGEVVGTVNTRETNQGQLIKMMVGRTMEEIYPHRHTRPEETILKLSKVSRQDSFTDISFALARGEILGLFGLVGSGRTEIARSIFGAELHDSGEMYLEGKVIRPRSPYDALKAGIALLTEDRKRDGLVMSCSIRDNGGLATMNQVSQWGFLNRQQQEKQVQSKVQELKLQPAGIPLTRLVRTLSGGNQQKVVLAKWLLSQAKVLILDEPTRGVDVGAKVDIYHIINELATNGVAILLISSELLEILGMSDRMLVMREGRLVGEFTREQASEEKLLAYAAGVVQA